LLKIDNVFVPLGKGDYRGFFTVCTKPPQLRLTPQRPLLVKEGKTRCRAYVISYNIPVPKLAFRFILNDS